MMHTTKHSANAGTSHKNRYFISVSQAAMPRSGNNFKNRRRKKEPKTKIENFNRVFMYVNCPEEISLFFQDQENVLRTHRANCFS